MVKETMEKIKTIFTWIIAIIIIAIFIIPVVMFIIYLRKNNQTLQIYPEIKIITVTDVNNTTTNLSTLKDAIRVADEVTKRIKK